MNPSPPSRLEQWFVFLLCICIAIYGLHGLVYGVFYLPARRGPMPTVEGFFVLIPLLACWLVAAGLAVREHILLPQFHRRRTAVELSLLFAGISLWLFSLYLSSCKSVAP